MSTIYSPIARICPKGATLPTNPTDGMWWLHNPTGREVLLQYANGAWNPIISFGSMTVNVDHTAGSDNQNNGGGTGASAFATMQFAVNQIPGLVGGNVIVQDSHANGDVYRETVTIQGKQFAGAYTITIQGKKAADSLGDTVATSAANPVGNGVAGFGTLTKTAAGWTVNAFQKLFIEITAGTGSGQKRVIHSNTATVLTIVGTWGTVPDATSHFHIFDCGTRITGSNAGADTTAVRNNAVLIQNGQQSVILDTLKINYCIDGSVDVIQQANCTAQYCTFNNSDRSCNFSQGSTGSVLYCQSNTQGTADIYVDTYSSVLNITACRGTGSATGVQLQIGGAARNLTDCYFGACTVSALYMTFQSFADVEGQTTFDGSTSDNILIDTFSAVYFASGTTTVSQNAGGWGCNCTNGGFGESASGITYSANTSGTRNPTTGISGGTS